MDPQKLSQLDPKLREAYQRVMGTTIPEPQAPIQTQPPTSNSPTPQPIPTPEPTPAPEPAPPPTPIIQEPPAAPVETPIQPLVDFIPQSVSEPKTALNPEPQIAPPAEPVIPQQFVAPAANFDQLSSEIAGTQTASNFSGQSSEAPQIQAILQKKKNHFKSILAGVVILAFLAIYALFWTKVFNLKLPF